MPGQIRVQEGGDSRTDRLIHRLADVSVSLGTGAGIGAAVAMSLLVEVGDVMLHPSSVLVTPFALVVVIVAWLSTPASTIFAVLLGSTLCSIQEVVVRHAPVVPSTIAADALRLLTLGALAFLAYQLRDALRDVQAAAIRDPLTGLLNRRGFFELAEREVARSQRDGSPFTVVEMDLDGLKQVNDAHGHAAGDALLVRFAEHAAGRLRETDVLGRTGGDEFSLVLPLGPAAAAAVIRDLIDVPDADGKPLLSISAGAVSYPRASVPLHAALIAADKEMYVAKVQGTGLSVVVMPE
jgi:diguanylate cyclase (GGDEF)-like protein